MTTRPLLARTEFSEQDSTAQHAQLLFFACRCPRAIRVWLLTTLNVVFHLLWYYHCAHAVLSVSVLSITTLLPILSSFMLLFSLSMLTPYPHSLRPCCRLTFCAHAKPHSLRSHWIGCFLCSCYTRMRHVYAVPLLCSLTLYLPSSDFQRFDSEKAGDREVQRTMLELLNQLDGFSSSEEIKVGFISPCLRLLFGVLLSRLLAVSLSCGLSPFSIHTRILLAVPHHHSSFACFNIDMFFSFAWQALHFPLPSRSHTLLLPFFLSSSLTLSLFFSSFFCRASTVAY